MPPALRLVLSHPYAGGTDAANQSSHVASRKKEVIKIKVLHYLCV